MSLFLMYDVCIGFNEMISSRDYPHAILITLPLLATLIPLGILIPLLAILLPLLVTLPLLATLILFAFLPLLAILLLLVILIPPTFPTLPDNNIKKRMRLVVFEIVNVP